LRAVVPGGEDRSDLAVWVALVSGDYAVVAMQNVSMRNGASGTRKLALWPVAVLYIQAVTWSGPVRPVARGSWPHSRAWGHEWCQCRASSSFRSSPHLIVRRRCQ
jgi:hypothetical protein